MRERDQHGHVTSWHDVVDEDQAAIVREIVDQLLAGETLRAIADALNAREVPTPKAAGMWRHSTVRKLALRPANVADRVHHGEVIGRAAWPAIISRDKHERVTALLSDPKRRTSRDGARRHLLSYGIGECGVCGAVLRRHINRSRGYEYSLYVCAENWCVGRSHERVDELVSAVVIERLRRPDAIEAFGPDEQAATAAAEQAEVIRARLDLAADQYADGVIDGRQLEWITGKLRPQLEAVEREARQTRSDSRLGV